MKHVDGISDLPHLRFTTYLEGHNIVGDRGDHLECCWSGLIDEARKTAKNRRNHRLHGFTTASTAFPEFSDSPVRL